MRRLMMLSCLVMALPALAQTSWRTAAVPAYTVPAYVAGQTTYWYAPRAHEFVDAARQLRDTLAEGCTGSAVRQRFVATLLAWDRLSTVAIGPLIERRSPRRIDFMPTRPEAIERAIELAPKGEEGMQRIGSAAKGLPALEWLLFKRADKTGAACRYAAEVAADIAVEAKILADAFDAIKAKELDEAAAKAGLSEALNQWIGAVEQLRVQGIERPLGEMRVRGHAKPQFARDASGASVDERKARWQTLRDQAVFEGRKAPVAGEALLPLEAYLRGKGLNPLADRLVTAVKRVDGAITNPGRLEAASKALAGLKTLAEAEIAPALDISIGFSDADGD